MPDFDFPDDLVKLQRAFLEADAECARLAGQLPSNLAVLEGKAEITAEHEKTRAGLEEQRARRLAIVDELYTHRWFVDNPDDQLAARAELRKLGQAQLAAAGTADGGTSEA